MISYCLLTDGLHDPAAKKVARDAARCVILQFDTYLRPDYAIELTGADVLKPTSARHTLWTIMVRRSDDLDEGSAADLSRAAARIERRRPGKTGEHDCAVLVGEAASAAAGRGFVTPALRAWTADLNDDDLLFPTLNLAAYNRALQWAVRRLGLEPLCLVAHSARHGGASCDAVLAVRDFAAIQSRGLWKDPRSVARYKKPGLYNKQLTRMTPVQLRDFSVVVKKLPSALVGRFFL
jgi:hypothetical protein